MVGAGAIGGFLAAALARAGQDVAVVARGAHLDAIRRHGIRVESDLGSFEAAVTAGDALHVLPERDVLLLTFKAHQWPAFLPQLRPFASKDVVVATLQNGLPFWFVREPPLRSVDPGGEIGRLFPDERVIGAVVHVSGHVAAPGLVRQSGGLRYVLGAPGGGTSAAGDRLAAAFRNAGLAAEIDRDIRATVWLKLVNNAGLNPVSVLAGSSIKRMLADSATRTLVRELMIEALNVGSAIGAVPEVDVEERIEYAARLDDVKTSMLQDFEHHRPLELEPILGAIVELAARHGVAVPRSHAIYERLRHLTPAAP